MENGCITNHTPFSQSRSEINYLLQGGMSGKGSVSAKPSGSLGTLLAWRTLFWAYLTKVFSARSMAHVPEVRILSFKVTLVAGS